MVPDVVVTTVTVGLTYPIQIPLMELRGATHKSWALVQGRTPGRNALAITNAIGA